MKIAIIMSGQAVEPGGGVRMQGIMWRDGLRLLGHDVNLINFWEEYNWNQYNAIIVLQMTGYFDAVIKLLSKNNPNIIFAPILDPGPNASIFRYKFLAKYLSGFCYSRIGRITHLSSEFTKFYTIKEYVKCFLTRSKQETDYVTSCFDIPVSKISQIPLSLRFDPLNRMPIEKENFCLHVSRLASPNKNVEKLISAAKKYGFKLKLAGYLHGQEEYNWLMSQTRGYDNIEYLGAVNDKELIDLYKKAKVFALPSYVEGVGMVAMEAAAYGCEIVLTNLGAPKDYYNGLAYLINPYSVDDIGRGILKCISRGYSQPKLLEFISKEYSLKACTLKLEQTINCIVES